MTASAKMPSSCKGTYRRIAVVETSLAPGEVPAMISDRAKGVVRIVETWERLHVGKTRRSEYFRALEDAEKLLQRLMAKDAIAFKRQRKAREASHAKTV
jgi:hypothetical protein